MASIPNIPIWVDFFETLRELPELWKVKSEIYKDRNKKNKAWTKLLNVYKQIDANANVDSLKKRLGNIRTCYRRELKKVEQSQRSGVGADDEYVPSLWYFESLDFLRVEGILIPEISIIDFEQDEGESDPEQRSVNNEGVENASSPSHRYKRKKPMLQHSVERNKQSKEALERLTNKETYFKDDASIFAESWAASYRKLSLTQQIYAKKAIEEILVLGQLELLSFYSVISPSSNS